MSWRAPLVAILVLGAVSLGCTGAVSAGEPTEIVKRTTDQVLKILEDPQLQGTGKEAQKQQLLRQVADEVFNWPEMARRALATHWRERTPEQRQEFVGLFRDLVERTYMNRLEQAVAERRDIQYLGEEVDGSRAVVKTKAITARNLEVPLDYRLSKVGDRWQIYDILVEGVSLVNNYRSQFNRIITTSSYDALIERMKAREIESAGGGQERRVQ
jgi:phospholipid transport system substrate-binding protein